MCRPQRTLGASKLDHVNARKLTRMARRYDSRTTIFSPEGRLFQVEYAMDAISHAGSAIGILSPKEGVVLAAEKKLISKLLEPTVTSEKMYRIDGHCACVVAGITADANILLNNARLSAQRYLYTYQESIPIEILVQELCDLKQGYTQYGGLRPFGVSFLYAGWDRHYGFQLYASDPSGNYSGWKATAIGANSQAAQSIIKTDYKEEFTLKDSIQLAIKVLAKTMDSTTLTADKLEFSTLTRDEHGKVVWRMLSEAVVSQHLKDAKLETLKQDDS